MDLDWEDSGRGPGGSGCRSALWLGGGRARWYSGRRRGTRPRGRTEFSTSDGKKLSGRWSTVHCSGDGWRILVPWHSCSETARARRNERRGSAAKEVL
ncbi:extensin [Iris pallida]|uniref:Extensin n=1 Tax=Iris pallida TaxID=29817 RepID=A0AAX6GLR0_IRIPA|nr:extensin [Iris pallida]